MPAETDRVTGKKKVKLPDDTEIFIPVVQRITFTDASARYQETQHAIDNSTESNRSVHVDNVFPVEDGNQSSTDVNDALKVERIDIWRNIDASERAQETEFTIDNVTGNDLLPPSFTNHLKTHVVRYYEDPDNLDDGGVWIDSELIDELSVIDASDRAQESIYTLANPDPGSDAQVPPDAADVTEYDESGDPVEPLRTDPFQNIINFSSGIYLIITFDWRDFLTSNLGERCTLVQTTPNPIINVFTPGVQVREFDASYITVQLDDPDTGVLNALINSSTSTDGQPETVTTPTQALGYAKFPSCFVCTATTHAAEIIYPPQETGLGGAWPVSPCTGAEPLVYADPVPYNGYTISFLFDIAPSGESNPTAERTDISFRIVGLPSPRTAVYLERTLPVLPSGSTIGNKKFEYVTQDTSFMRFQARTYDKSAVDVYLTDTAFPLRLKNIIPTAPGARQTTKDGWKTLVDFSPQGWVDPSNNLHEPLTDEEFSTGDEMGTFGFNTGNEDVILKFEFDKLTVGPGPGDLPANVPVKRPLAWPKDPANITVTAVLSGSIPSGTFTTGDFDPREYTYGWRIAGNVPENSDETDFGEQPGHVSA